MQLFPPRANAIVRTVLATVAATVLLGSFALWAVARSPAATGQYTSVRQPIPFSHPLHVNGLRIDCRYCHVDAERAAFAGLPPTDACVPCHMDGLLQLPAFAALRESLATGRAIPWVRVTSVPAFVFFNHAVHVRRGVDCQTCHGPVELMPQVYQTSPLTMEWCLECHRAPERHMGRMSAVALGWVRPDPANGESRAARYDVQRLTSCTTCHR